MKTFPLAAAVVVLSVVGLSASLLFPSEGIEVRNLVMEPGKEGILLIEADEITLTGTISPGEQELVIDLSKQKAKDLRLKGKISIRAGEALAENIQVVVNPFSLENEGVGAFLLLVVESGREVELRGLKLRNLKLHAMSMQTSRILLKGLWLD